MRAIFAPELFDQLENEIKVSYQGDKVHHLVKVVRIKPGEKILVLNGLSEAFEVEILGVSKNEVKLAVKGRVSESFRSKLDLAICRPKKDALSLILKMAVELAIGRIYIIESDFSNKEKVTLSDEKMRKFLIGALEQSNHKTLPELIVGKSLKDLFAKDYDQYFVLHVEKSGVTSQLQTRSGVFIVGPEGGFSREEIDFFKTIKKLEFIHRCGPIMRAPTAVAWGVGHIEKT